jgi:hypothetical protein
MLTSLFVNVVQGGSLYVQGGSLYVQGGSLYVQGGSQMLTSLFVNVDQPVHHVWIVGQPVLAFVPAENNCANGPPCMDSGPACSQMWTSLFLSVVTLCTMCG